MDHTVTTSEKILASARELIIAGGYNGFSYADIARVVGIRKASIHHHFPTKADLVRDLVIAYREEAEAGLAMTEQQAPDAFSALRGYVGYWQHCITQTSRPFCICALLATEMPVLPAEVATEVQRFFSYLSRWTHRQMERGTAEQSLRLADTAQAEAEGFIASVHGAMLLARAYGTADIFAQILDPALRRLAPH